MRRATAGTNLFLAFSYPHINRTAPESRIAPARTKYKFYFRLDVCVIFQTGSAFVSAESESLVEFIMYSLGVVKMTHVGHWNCYFFIDWYLLHNNHAWRQAMKSSIVCACLENAQLLESIHNTRLGTWMLKGHVIIVNFTDFIAKICIVNINMTMES